MMAFLLEEHISEYLQQGEHAMLSKHHFLYVKLIFSANISSGMLKSQRVSSQLQVTAMPNVKQDLFYATE